MDSKTCLQKLKLVGVLAFATVDENNNPQIRNISAIHYEDDGMYFFTARGKNFSRELQNNGKVQVLGYTRFKEMIRLSGKAVPVPGEEQKKWMDVIFEEHPYLANLYPGDTRKIGIIYGIRDAKLEYFNLGVNPVFRETYTLGKGIARPKGYYISEECIQCSACREVCPQHCIEEGHPFTITQEHCLHCGACCEICPAGAVKRYE